MKCQRKQCIKDAEYAMVLHPAALDIEVYLCESDYLWFFDHNHGNREQILKEAVLAPSVL